MFDTLLFCLAKPVSGLNPARLVWFCRVLRRLLGECLDCWKYRYFSSLETKKKGSVDPTEKTPPCEEAWHQELRSAYMQQYVQYMQSLRFIVVQTRPQSPKQARRYVRNIQILTSEQYHMEILLNSFRLNGHTLGLSAQT